jgi:hypothetical protein
MNTVSVSGGVPVSGLRSRSEERAPGDEGRRRLNADARAN